MSIAAQIADPSQAVVAQGVIDWVNNKSMEVSDTTKLVVGAVSLIGIGVVAVISRFAMAKIFGALFVAALLNWGVHNITDVSDKVGEEVNSMSSTSVVDLDRATDSADGLV